MNQSGLLKISFAQVVIYPEYLQKEIDAINTKAKSETKTNDNNQQARRERRDRRLNVFSDRFVEDPTDIITLSPEILEALT